MVFIIPILLIVFILAAVMWRKSRYGPITSFWDAVRNPHKMPDLAEYHKMVDESARALSGSKEEIAGLVDFFVFEAKSSWDAGSERKIIAKLGEKTYPRALEILRDESLFEKLVAVVEGKYTGDEAPLSRLTEIFDGDAPPPPEAALLLSRFLRHESDEIRKRAALIIGSVGAVQSLPDLALALKDEDEYVKSYALMGILRAINGGRIDPSHRSEFYALVAGMWPEDTCFNVCEIIPKILLRLDRERAVQRLLQPDLFTAKFEPVWRILEVLAEESVEIPREKLLALIAEAGVEPIEYPLNNVMEGALSHLGRHRMPEDLALLERLVDHPDEKVCRGAIDGLYAYHRFFERIRESDEVIRAQGWDALTAAEKHLVAVKELNLEIDNGGFAQYYFNHYGDRWKDALDGLAAMGATKRHRIMLSTLEAFGPKQVSQDHDTRRAQLAKIARKKEYLFDEHDNLWYKTKVEPLDRLIFRYNLAHTQGRDKSGPPESGAADEII